MKSLGVLIAFAGSASADAPPGVYHLTPRGERTQLLSSIQPPVKIPSCGQAAIDFFDRLVLTIDASVGATVNGESWPDTPDQHPGTWSVFRVDPMTGFHVEISFARDPAKPKRAGGGAVIARFGKQQGGRSARFGVLCADGIVLRGRYRTHAAQ